jgi:DNA helicase-2/ATP-dependent DNA helicase PcrA
MSAGLNAAQREAVFTPRGPMLVLAGAGTGKTRVVTHRIAQLIRLGTAPARILAVTFTNKAAAEMQQRARELLGRRQQQKPEISTFHSLCMRILRRQIQHLGYPKEFAIYDRGDQEGLARSALREIRVAGEVLRPGDLLSWIGRWKSGGVRPAQAASAAGGDKEHLAALGYRRYQNALRAAGAVDFDDLLLLTEDLFTQFPAVRAEEARRFDHVMVDEYQDTNASQYRIVRSLAGEHRNLCVVGDDDQSIYAWRGAEVTHILRFKHDWPEAKMIRLEENYRSTAAILELANRLIAFNKVRHDKVLRAARPGGDKPRILQFKDETEEAKQVVREIAERLEQASVQPRDLAILFRTNEQPRAFEMELRKQKIPYVLVGGMSFYDRKEVRDVLAYLRALVNPRDEASLLRIINRPARGLGDSSVATLMKAAVSEGITVWEAIPKAAQLTNLSPAVVASFERFRSLIERRQKELEQGPPLAVARGLIDEVNYLGEIEKAYPDPAEREARTKSVEEVFNALASFQAREGESRMGDFLDEMALADRGDSDDKEKQLARNAVALMTLHSAKGLEFPEVFLVGLEEGFLPHHRAVDAEGDAIDEERRLCYVGITRAQDRLTMSLALGRMKWGKPRPTVPSRFLFELTGQAEKAPTARRAGPHGKGKPAARPSAGRKP